MDLFHQVHAKNRLCAWCQPQESVSNSPSVPQNHLIVTVPPYHNLSITSPTTVGIFIMTNAGRSHDAQTFTYTPESGMTLALSGRHRCSLFYNWPTSQWHTSVGFFFLNPQWIAKSFWQSKQRGLWRPTHVCSKDISNRWHLNRQKLLGNLRNPRRSHRWKSQATPLRLTCSRY